MAEQVFRVFGGELGELVYASGLMQLTEISALIE
jgi:hypothetical protein